MKQRIRLTENDLHRIIKESVKRVLNEYNAFGAQSAYAKASNAFDQLSPVQQNSPYGQKLQRQMYAFDQYNSYPTDGTKNAYGRTQNDAITDIIKAAGLNCKPEQLLAAYNKYESNGEKFDYNNMTQYEMQILQKALPIMNMNSQNDPRQNGMVYQQPKKGFLGFGRKTGGWTYQPQ